MFVRKYEVYHDHRDGIDEYHCDDLLHENGSLILGAVFDRGGRLIADRVYLSLAKGTARVNVNSGWEDVATLVKLKVA